MELVAGASILAWVIAAGLLGALLVRRPSRRPHTHPWPQAAELLGKPLPPAANEAGLHQDAVRGILFLESGKGASDELLREIASASPPEGLVAVGGKSLSGYAHPVQITDGAAVQNLRDAFGIDATPYLWVLQGGLLRAGGSVSRRSDIDALISLTTRVVGDGVEHARAPRASDIAS